MRHVYVYLLVVVLSATAMWQVQNWRFAAKERDRLEMQAKELARKADRVDQAAVRHEKDKKQIRTRERVVIQEVEREVEKPVYRNQCLTPDSLRILSDHIDGKGAGEPAGAVSEPAKAR